MAAHWSLFNRPLLHFQFRERTLFLKLLFNCLLLRFPDTITFDNQFREVRYFGRQAKSGSKFSYSSQIVRLRHNNRPEFGESIDWQLLPNLQKGENNPYFLFVYEMFWIGEMHLNVARLGPPGYLGMKV